MVKTTTYICNSLYKYTIVSSMFGSYTCNYKLQKRSYLKLDYTLV